uniref:Uncharacterized protein n=1 Tax=Arion vulgaris TaxID=1028688 RepID=A0A0B7AW85_9EUPU
MRNGRGTQIISRTDLHAKIRRAIQGNLTMPEFIASEHKKKKTANSVSNDQKL